MNLQKATVAALMEATRLGLPHDIQELLIHGNRLRGIAPGILQKMIVAATSGYPAKECTERLDADGKCKACGWNAKTRSYELAQEDAARNTSPP